jgi:hypothetical protein
VEPFNLDKTEASQTCKCEECGNIFTMTGVVLQFFSTFRFCSEKCSEIAYTRHKSTEPKRDEGGVIVPLIYRDTDLNRLPVKLKEAAMTWHPKVGEGNLLIHGTSRSGKTRTAWYIAQRLAAEGYKVQCYTVRQLEEKLYEAAGKNGHHAAFRSVASAQVLFIDDLGKEHMSKAGRLAPDLFALLDERTQWRKPIIFTTNHLGDGLRERFGDAEMGTAFVARLREFFDIVHP